MGNSLNLDFLPNAKVKLRTEGRQFDEPNPGKVQAETRQPDARPVRRRVL